MSHTQYMDGSTGDWGISSKSAMEIPQFCTEPFICYIIHSTAPTLTVELDMSPGGHYWDYYICSLSPLLSYCNSLQGWTWLLVPLIFNSLWPSDAIRRQGTESTLAQVMACCLTAPSHNSLWPSDAIRRQGTESTLAQVMACCLTAPSHYIYQCWLIISKIEWHSSKGKFRRDTSAINHWNYLEN